MDFQDGGRLPSRAWLGGRLLVLYKRSREFACVFGLSELQFLGFQGWAVIATATGIVGREFASVVREFTRVQESLRAFSDCLNCSSRDFSDGL